MTKLTVQIEPELMQRLRLVAVQEQKTVSAIIREFVSWYVAKKEGDVRV